jgi:hypothetical protein
MRVRKPVLVSIVLTAVLGTLSFSTTLAYAAGCVAWEPYSRSAAGLTNTPSTNQHYASTTYNNPGQYDVVSSTVTVNGQSARKKQALTYVRVDLSRAGLPYGNHCVHREPPGGIATQNCRTT